MNEEEFEETLDEVAHQLKLKKISKGLMDEYELKYK